ncbi:hypothetical protein [Undibacterium sp. RuTC16W]|uniref:hypothetical protein n=1 Tax=Undibacterium sp. RuTC16W TaxID=3413048 RepID=UPI003BEFF37F
MTPQEKQERAVALTLRTHKTADPSNAFIRSELADMFGGTIFTVTWQSGKENRPVDSFVFFDGDKEHFFFNGPELFRFLNGRRQRNPFISLLRELFTVGGAPAVIAIGITVTICYLAITHVDQPPPTILSHALTTILGFYFGSKVARDKKPGNTAADDAAE